MQFARKASPIPDPYSKLAFFMDPSQYTMQARRNLVSLTRLHLNNHLVYRGGFHSQTDGYLEPHISHCGLTWRRNEPGKAMGLNPKWETKHPSKGIHLLEWIHYGKQPQIDYHSTITFPILCSSLEKPVFGEMFSPGARWICGQTRSFSRNSLFFTCFSLLFFRCLKVPTYSALTKKLKVPHFLNLRRAIRISMNRPGQTSLLNGTLQD